MIKPYYQDRWKSVYPAVIGKKMSMKYIRDTYGVPAKRGMEITFQKCEHVSPVKGWIVGSRGQYLRVRFAGNLGLFTLHPTWNITYKNHIQPTANNCG